jgi:outer membrane lipoprotein-sorting protein
MKKWPLWCFLGLLFFSGCKSQGEPVVNDYASSETIVAATPPFKTKEPDRYRGTRITTVQTSNGEARITKLFIARDGDMRRHESGTGAAQTVYLERPEGRFVLLVAEKVYVDVTATPEISPSQEDVTPEWIVHSDTGTTSYQKLGMEVVGGRNAEKYRIIVNTPTSGSVIVSETFLWIDEALQMPIRSEMKGSDGVKITTELTDVALDVDNRVFQVPDDYQKITYTEFMNRLRKQ